MAIKITNIMVATPTTQRSLTPFETHQLARLLEKYILTKGIIAEVKVE